MSESQYLTRRNNVLPIGEAAKILGTLQKRNNESPDDFVDDLEEGSKLFFKEQPDLLPKLVENFENPK